MAGYDLHLRVWRGDASGGDLVDYTVPVEEGMVVLDAVHRVQATQAGDLAVRWNCKAGKCGSCSAEINGMPRLMCMTRLNLYDPGQPITVTPMRTFPVLRDLVTDVSFNFEMAKRVPAFAPKPREADGTYRMAQKDIERLQEFRKCIECFLCQNTCHVIRDHEENKEHFAGPRFFIRYAELDMHPLDTNDRRRLTQDVMGLGFCNITKCCTEVCPEGIKITDNGIIPLKERVVDAKYDPLVWITDRISPRRQRRTQVGPAEPSRAPAPAPTPSVVETPSSLADAGVGLEPAPPEVPAATLDAAAAQSAAPEPLPIQPELPTDSELPTGPPTEAVPTASVPPTEPVQISPPPAYVPPHSPDGPASPSSWTDGVRARVTRALPAIGGLVGAGALYAVWRRRRR